ncbi:MAG TPA: hypothetical protein VEA41_20240, partial [Salinarimonas sp.]|nr:hypothetical protein [Salinarimonas sp.]
MSLDTLDPDLRDSVREAARRAGMSIQDWVAATVADRAQRLVEHPPVRRRGAAAPPAPPAHAADELDAVAAKISRLASGRGGAPRDYDVPRGGPTRDYDALVSGATAETERRARENAAKTAVALDAVARWIEQAETRLDRTARVTAERTDRTQAVLGEALGLMTRRLSDIERKIETAPPPGLDKALKAIERVEAQVARATAEAQSARATAERGRDPGEVETALRSFEERIAAITERIAAQPRPMGRRGVSARDELKSAVAEIRQRQAELDEAEPPVLRPTRGAAAPEAAASHSAIEALRADIARLTGGFEPARQASGEDPATAALRAEIGELHQALGTLATRGEVGTLEEAVRDLTRLVTHARDQGGDVAAITAPVEDLQAEVRRLSESVAAGVHGRLAGDLENIARRIDGLAARGGDPAAAGDVMRQFAELRGVLAEIADPHRVTGLAEQMAELALQVQQIGRSQVDAIEFASLRAAVDEIRAHMRAAPRDAGLQAAGTREIAELSGKLERLTARLSDGDLEAFARKVETLSARMEDLSAAARGTDILGVGHRLDEIVGRLDAAAATPSTVGDQIKALADRMDTALLARADTTPIAPLIDRLDRLDESLRRPAPDLKPLEDMLRGLAARIDAGDRGADHDGLDALERQVAAIAQRLDQPGESDPALSALQRTMGDLMAQLDGMRED